ncbi:MAG: fumarate hydratase C-terminal domain-containing protein [Gallionella sp.]|nr:fumarate hydratase C-terminal domain-containing protein [Gallionella sp.]
MIVFTDLGMEAIYEFEVENMSVTVAAKVKWRSAHDDGRMAQAYWHDSETPSERTSLSGSRNVANIVMSRRERTTNRNVQVVHEDFESLSNEVSAVRSRR